MSGVSSGLGQGPFAAGLAQTPRPPPLVPVTNEGWRPAGWYLPGASMGPGDAAGAVGLGYSGVAGSDLKLIVVPQLFKQAGTITALGQALGNPTNGGHTSLAAIYRSKVGALWQPGGLAVSALWTGKGFNSTYTAAVSVAVAAGETLWFLSLTDAQATGAVLNVNPPNALPGVLGTVWDGITLPGTFRNGIGYAQVIGAFQNPPPDPYPSITDATDIMTSATFAAVPVPVFQFTPS